MKEISKNRIVIEKKGYQVILPKILLDENSIDKDSLKVKIVPLYCPVCRRILKSQDDIDTYRNNECCVNCDTYWAKVETKNWNNGWRPSKEEIESNINERGLDKINITI